MIKKISNFTVDDILQRRTFNSFNKQLEANTKCNKRKQTEQPQFEIDQNQILANILEQFNINTKNHTPSFSHDTKAQVLEIISKRLNLKLNALKIIPKMKIKKAQNISIIQKPTSNSSLNLNSHKKSSENIFNEPKKLESYPLSSKASLIPKKLSYFILSGCIYQFEKNTQLQKKKSLLFDEEFSVQNIFYNWRQFESQYAGFKKVKTYTQFMAYGAAFEAISSFQPQKSNQDEQNIKQSNASSQNQSKYKSSQLIVAENAVFVQIQNPDDSQDYINHLGMEFEKMAQNIENFPVFRPLGKKIRNFVQFFQFKEYQKNQKVFSIGDPVDKFYLLIKGQIVFEHSKSNPINTSFSTPQSSHKNSIHMQLTIKTETVSCGSYFGQEEMIFSKQKRLLSAKCKSSKCELLEITRQKFQRMLDYSDFYDSIKKAAEVKFIQRMSKLEKNQEIRTKFASSQFFESQFDQINLSTQRPKDERKISLFGTPKTSSGGRYKVMHGNIIKKFSKDQQKRMNETVEFSMLKVNPDMYEKTVDKFRKYNLKPKKHKKPKIKWELKRVWKVLNLENVLREQTEISEPEGRKFYDAHQRYVYQLKESKSLRPKTTSSTYRTKLQYIAYLQQFKPVN